MLSDTSGVRADDQLAPKSSAGALAFEVAMAALSLFSVILVGWVELADIEWPSARFRLWAVGRSAHRAHVHGRVPVQALEG